MKILYFGNRGTMGGKYASVQDELARFLSISFTLVPSSEKQGNLSKMTDMLLTFFRHVTSANFILIDTYSTLNFYYALVLGVLARLFRIPCVFILHGGELPKRLDKNAYLCKIMFSNAHALVAPSRYMKVEFEKRGYSPILIPNFIQAKNFPFTEKKPAELSLFWLRNFKKHYNPLLAVKVLRQLRNQGIEAKLTMVGPDGGDGSLQELENWAAKEGIKQHVKITGALAKEDWIEVSKSSNYLINTTNVDNTPLSVIECMALGLVVVSTNVGGLPYLLTDGDDASLVPPNDEQAMTQAIERLYLNPEEYYRQQRKARIKAESFDWEVVKKQWINLVENASKH